MTQRVAPCAEGFRQDRCTDGDACGKARKQQRSYRATQRFVVLKAYDLMNCLGGPCLAPGDRLDLVFGQPGRGVRFNIVSIVLRCVYFESLNENA